jgi:hypothetical protein
MEGHGDGAISHMMEGGSNSNYYQSLVQAKAEEHNYYSFAYRVDGQRDQEYLPEFPALAVEPGTYGPKDYVGESPCSHNRS